MGGGRMVATMTTTRSALAPPTTRAAPPWPLLVLLLAGQFMALLDVTIVNVAMPSISTDLHASGSALQLIVSGYTVSYAMLLITGARLGDLYGRRRMFLAGVLAFTVSSLACGLAPNVLTLVVARFAQGGGAALMMPQVMSGIQTGFAGRARAKALSLYSAVLAIGGVTGMVVGGAHRPITHARYDSLWTRIHTALPWTATQNVSTHWLRHTTLTWVERHDGYGIARDFAGHTDRKGASTTTYIRAAIEETATALSAMTGEHHPLARPATDRR
jgi:hypothetical protein